MVRAQYPSVKRAIIRRYDRPNYSCLPQKLLDELTGTTVISLPLVTLIFTNIDTHDLRNIANPLSSGPLGP